MRITPQQMFFRLHLAALAAILAALPLPATPADQIAIDALAYDSPLPGLSAAAQTRFAQGRAEFAARWVPFPSGGGHWGRGPQSSAESCAECHPGAGRGRAPGHADEAPVSLVLRLSVPGTDPVGGPRPHPVYGEQLNNRGVLGRLLEEGEFRVRYTAHTVRFPDGETVELRAPHPVITSLWYGALGRDAILSLRLARPLFGTGLLEQVPESAMRAIAERQREHGIHGRINRVWDATHSGLAAGRFGHKATHPSLRQQTASAFIIDIGVTSRLFPVEDCWPAQRRCYGIETVSGFEIRDSLLDLIVDYLRLLAPLAPKPSKHPEVRRGAALFARAQCDTCHVPELLLDDGRTIAPYSDLLLHNLGAALSDGRREFDAGPNDWRTAPLWGLGQDKAVNGNTGLLHDGRARTPQEAILWHGGEATASRQHFMVMPPRDRAALLEFLDSL